jgi:HEAT repeat protein
LLAGLDDKDAKVRWHFAEALGKMDGFAKEALPELRLLLQDPDDRVRQEARRAIIRIDPAALLEGR